MAYSKDEGWDDAEIQTIECNWMGRLHPLLENRGILEAEFPSLVQKIVWQFGPLVLEERTDLLTRYINVYMGMLTRRMEQMKKSNSTGIMTKIREVSVELALLEELRIWQ
jgi:tRNA (adenine22-N1)-methyltransferase